MKKKLCFFSGIVISVFVLMFSCTKRNAEQVAGNNTCDTTQVSYQNDVLPIVQSYCYPCHSNNNTHFSNGVSLEGYDNLKAWALAGYLVGDVRWDPGFTGMPYGKPRISDCAINTIVAWVNQGCQKN